MLLSVAPRIISLVGCTVNVRICSDACATGRGLAAVAFFEDGSEYFLYSHTAKAGAAFSTWLESANEICGLEMFAMGTAVVSPGALLRGERMILFVYDNAAAAASIKALSRAPVALETARSFWMTVAQLSASRWIGRVLSTANRADALRVTGPRNRTFRSE